MDIKDRMIEAYERGECGYYEAYDYVVGSMALSADLARKRDREKAEAKQRVEEITAAIREEKEAEE